MTKEMVTIAEFSSLDEASLLRSRLEAEGIPVFLQNETFAGMHPAPLQGYISTLLQVPADKAGRAMGILRKLHPEQCQQTESARPPANAFRGALKLLGAIAAFGALAVLLIYLMARGH